MMEIMGDPEYKIDRGEVIWERIYVVSNGEERCRFLITSDKKRDTYFLYEVADDGISAKKTHKARTPAQIWNKYLHGVF